MSLTLKCGFSSACLALGSAWDSQRTAEWTRRHIFYIMFLFFFSFFKNVFFRDILLTLVKHKADPIERKQHSAFFHRRREQTKTREDSLSLVLKKFKTWDFFSFL